MKTFITLLVTLIQFSCCFSQTTTASFLNSVSNKTIDFHIAIVAPSEGYRKMHKDKLLVSTYQIEVSHPKITNEVGKDVMQHLVRFLSDPAKDWAAHVLLTSITKRNVGSILTIEDRNDWISSCKTQDSLYWVNNFTNLK